MLASVQPKLINLYETVRSKYAWIRSNPRYWIKYAIIISVLLLSAVITPRMTPRLALVFFLFLAVVAATIIYLTKPPLGITFLIFASMLVPSPLGGSMGGILNTTILLVAFFGALWIFDMLVRHRQIKFVSSKINGPALALVIISFIAFLNGQLLYSELAHTAPLRNQIGGVGVYVFSIGALLLIANQVRELVWLRRMTALFLILGGFYIFFARLLPSQIADPIRSLFQYGSDASLFWTWFVSMTASQALFNQNLTRRWRVALFGLILATFYVSLSQAYDWKSGWVPASAAILVMVWLGFPRLRLFALFMAFFLAIFSFTNLEGVITGGEDYSLLTRFPAWSIVLEIFKLNPLLGVGIANYYWYTPIFQILGYTGLNFSSHNNYIDILAQMGIIGFLCFVWLFWQIGSLGWRLKEKVPQGFAYAYVIGALGGIVGTLLSGMIGDWIFPFVYNVGLYGFRSSVFAWLFIGGLVVLEQLYLRSDVSDSAT